MLTSIIMLIFFGIVSLLVVIGEQIINFICKKHPAVEKWFDNLPMNKEEY